MDPSKCERCQFKSNRYSQTLWNFLVPSNKRKVFPFGYQKQDCMPMDETDILVFPLDGSTSFITLMVKCYFRVACLKLLFLVFLCLKFIIHFVSWKLIKSNEYLFFVVFFFVIEMTICIPVCWWTYPFLQTYVMMVCIVHLKQLRNNVWN